MIIFKSDSQPRIIFFLTYVLPSETGIEDPKKCYEPTDEILDKFENVVNEFHNHSSDITASSLVRIVSNNPALASKHAA